MLCILVVLCYFVSDTLTLFAFTL